MIRWQGIVYRAHNPNWAHTPASGEGAAHHGGRFNRKGIPALYTSLVLKTAWMEAQQGFPFKLQPMTMVAYEVDCENIIDLTDNGIFNTLAIPIADIACQWEDIARRGSVPPSWALADRLVTLGVAGIIIPSFAPGHGVDDLNLVFWSWSDKKPHQVVEIDDYGRLPAQS